MIIQRDSYLQQLISHRALIHNQNNLNQKDVRF